MTTQVHYEVRKMVKLDWLANEAPFTLCGIPPDVAWLPEGHPNCEFTRVAAEEMAQIHGGTVHRVTTTTEPVGLQWFQDPKYKRHYLSDGDVHVGQVSHYDREGIQWVVYDASYRRASSIVEAKAAAVEAVKATWT